VQHLEGSTQNNPKLGYARKRRTNPSTSITAFWMIFWVLGELLVVGAIFATMMIARMDARLLRLLQLSAMIWGAAAVLAVTKHRLRFAAATAWAILLWLPLLYGLINEFPFHRAGLWMLFLPIVAAEVTIFATLTVAIAISLRFRLWRGRAMSESSHA
jgi:hypothetical protein